MAGIPVKIVYGGGALFPGQPFGTPAELNQLIDMLLENGVETIDTAQTYGDGTSEELLGESGAVHRINIDTRHCGGWIPGQSSTEAVVSRGRESLKKLKANKVHTFYIHAPDRLTSLQDSLRGINELYKEGSFERFGISNFTANEVKEVVKIARENNFVLPTVYQGHYSAVSRKSETDLFPILRKHGIVFYAYSPQAGGFLAKTKAQLVESSIEGRWDASSSAGQLFRSLYSRKALLEALDLWGQISSESNIPRAELAYRWITFHSLLGPGDAIIFSASSQRQLDQTLTGIKQGPLPPSVAERIGRVWELVKEEAPLDHFNREF